MQWQVRLRSASAHLTNVQIELHDSGVVAGREWRDVCTPSPAGLAPVIVAAAQNILDRRSLASVLTEELNVSVKAE
jgi:hypothetical protein